MNHISVGALADNYRPETVPHLSNDSKPDLSKLLYSTDGEVSLSVEDEIPTDHHKVILI